MKFRAGFAVLLATLISACQTAAIPAGVVLVNEDEMSELVSVDRVGKAKTATGTLKVWASIRNLSDKRLMVEARAIFRGKGGESIEEPSGWRQVFIEPNTEASFEAYSMSTKAEQMLIEVREGNR